MDFSFCVNYSASYLLTILSYLTFTANQRQYNQMVFVLGEWFPEEKYHYKKVA